MDIVFLNPALVVIGNIDVYESFLWIERYYEAGEFEIITTPSLEHRSLATKGYYVSIAGTDRLMVVEDVNFITDPVDGNKLIIKGRSIETLLDRRIIWQPVNFENTSFQNSIYTMLDQNALNPTDPLRKINLLEFEWSTDPEILTLILSAQIWGKGLYTTIVDLCFANRVGFKVILTDDKKFCFKLYKGVDRSYYQTDNPYVIFSPDFENLKNATYITSDKLLKNTSLTFGDKGVGNAPVFIEITLDQYGDLNRREMVIDGSDVSRVDPEGNEIPFEVYLEHLQQRTLEELFKTVMVESLSSELDPIGTYIYGEDFFLGDIIQVANLDKGGIETRSQMIELVRSVDLSGIKVYPVFNTAPTPLEIEEYVTLRKYLGMQYQPNSAAIYTVWLGIGIEEEVAEDFYEAVGLGKNMGILTEAFGNVSLNKFVEIEILETVTPGGI